MPDPIVVTRDGAVATVALNNPERLNALNRAMWAGLGEIMRALSADDGLRCIVVRGAGEKAFAAGADIAEFATERAASKPAKRYGKLVHETMRAVARCRHPTVALIRGACVGGGLEIAAMCDLRIAGQSSRFGIPVNKLGLTMAYGELMGLLALAGRAVALEILLEGRVFDAAEARDKGLLHRIADDVKAEAAGSAARIARGAPLAARMNKQLARRLAVEPAALSEQELREVFAFMESHDYREGVQSFLQKRAPIFTGK